MATKAIVGSADFTYTAQGSTSGSTHQLAAPLLISPSEGFVSRRLRRTFSAWSADLSIREVFTVGDGVDEIEGRIRFEDEPAQLRTMLKEGLENDVTLTYRPNGSTGSSYPAKLVAVDGNESGKIPLRPDRDRFPLGEYQTSIILRRVDGNDFEGLL